MSLRQAANVLRVSTTASNEEVREAYRRGARETHPDYTVQVLPETDPGFAAEKARREKLFLKVQQAKETFEEHFALQRGGSSLLGQKMRAQQEKRAREARAAAGGSPSDNRPRASREHAQRQVDRPYYGGEVNWPSLSPRWEETKNSAVIGLRSDGQVDLLVNNTYITTLSSLLGVVEHLKEIINAQPGAGPTSWEGYIVYLARQSTGEITPVGLLRLWERVMFEEGGTLHAPDLRKATRSTPDDFS